MKSCNEKPWEKATALVNTHLKKGWLTFQDLFCFAVLVSPEAPGCGGYLWPFVPGLRELSVLSTVAAESIYSLNCHLVHQRLGTVSSTGYRTLGCRSAQSPNFVSSRVFSLVHCGDLALKRVICCRWMYRPLHDETWATCFVSEQILRLL